MRTIERHETGWRIRAGGLELNIDRKTGCLSRLVIVRDKEHVWTEHTGDVTVRDDRLERTFGVRHIDKVSFEEQDHTLIICKTFCGAPWRLVEVYRLDQGCIAWTGRVELDHGPFRSCAITYHIPWPQPLYGVSLWAARDGMPSAPHRYATLALEYGELTSGILIPAAVFYDEQRNAGLLLHMPFDFKTPRLRFVSGYREPDLEVEFDRLALARGKPARASLLLRGTGVGEEPRLEGRRLPSNSVIVRTADADRIRRVTLQQPGGKIASIRFGRENGAIQFDLPGRTVAALAELHLEPQPHTRG